MKEDEFIYTLTEFEVPSKIFQWKSLAVNWIYGVGIGQNSSAVQSSSKNTEE